jgi:hypothetical protein
MTRVLPDGPVSHRVFRLVICPHSGEMTGPSQVAGPSAECSPKDESVVNPGAWRVRTAGRRPGHGPCFLYITSRSPPVANGVLGSCPDGPGGERGGGTSGGGGSSWAGCVCRGPAKTAQCGFRRTPLHAGKSRRREENGIGFASGDAKRAVCQRLLCEHARAAATRHDEPWRRGGEGLSASSTRDLCRTLPPRPTTHFTPSRSQ